MDAFGKLFPTYHIPSGCGGNQNYRKGVRALMLWGRAEEGQEVGKEWAARAVP